MFIVMGFSPDELLFVLHSISVFVLLIDFLIVLYKTVTTGYDYHWLFFICFYLLNIFRFGSIAKLRKNRISLFPFDKPS